MDRTNTLENELELQDSDLIKKLIINHAVSRYFIKPTETIMLGQCSFPCFSSDGAFALGILQHNLKENEQNKFFSWNLGQKNEKNQAHKHEILIEDFEQDIFSIDFHEKTKQLIIGGTEGLVSFYSNFDGTNTPLFQKGEYVDSEDELWTTQFNHDGTLAATCGGDSAVRMWDTKTGQEMWSVGDQDEIAFTKCDFSSDGQLVIVGSNDNNAYIYDAQTGQEPQVLKGHEQEVGSVAISPDKSRYATGSEDRTARLWDGKNGRLIALLDLHMNEVVSVVFDAQSRYLATGDRDGKVCLWHARDGKHIQTIQLDNDCIQDLKFLPNEIIRICSNDDSFNARINDYNLEKLVAASTALKTQDFKLHDLLIVLNKLQTNNEQEARTSLRFHGAYNLLSKQYKELIGGKHE